MDKNSEKKERKKTVLAIIGIFFGLIIFISPWIILPNILSSHPQEPFFINQRYVDIRIYPDAQVACQRSREGWYCNGFDYIERSLLEVIDFKMTYTDKIPAVLKMTGLNKKINRVVGRRYLNEEEEEETFTSADKKANRTTEQGNER